MGVHNVFRNGETEAGAGIVLIAGLIEPHEGFEDLFPFALIDAGAVIVNLDSRSNRLLCTARTSTWSPCLKALPMRFDMRRENEVGTHMDKWDHLRPVLANRLPSVSASTSNRSIISRSDRYRPRPPQHRRGQSRDSLAACPACHRHRPRAPRFPANWPDQRKLQAKTGQHGAQIVADAGQHRRSLFHRAFDTVPHFNERRGCPPNFSGPTRPKIIRNRPALAEALFGRFGQPLDRPDLVAQKQNGNGNQYHRCAYHPEQEDMRIGRIGVDCGERRTAPHRSVKQDAEFRAIRSHRPCRSRNGLSIPQLSVAR